MKSQPAAANRPAAQSSESARTRRSVPLGWGSSSARVGAKRCWAILSVGVEDDLDLMGPGDAGEGPETKAIASNPFGAGLRGPAISDPAEAVGVQRAEVFAQVVEGRDVTAAVVGDEAVGLSWRALSTRAESV